MTNKDSEKIIDALMHWLKNERELYGDFALQSGAGNKSHSNAQSNSIESSNASTKDTKPRGSKVNRQQPIRNETASGEIEAQEKLFYQNEQRDIYYQIPKCKSLEELEELCRNAEVLHTDLEGTNLVFGVGNPEADLMLIGEAPGAEEDKQGEPFVGAAGQLLNKILEAINFKREDVYIANILKHRPPNNRNPLPEERKRSLPFLLRQIDLIEPKLILCLGKVSAQTLLDNDNTLSSMRGKFHKYRGKYELMATYHPAALLRHSKWKRPTWEDVQLLRKRYDELGCKP